jgi:hypothetical protein
VIGQRTPLTWPDAYFIIRNMNCDFTLSGCLPEAELQEKVIAFYRTFFSREMDLTILPKPDQRYSTHIHSARFGLQLVEPNYPFNFFGVIPIASENLAWHRQMVFDRTDGGRLVRFCKLPDVFGILSYEEYRSKETPEVVLYEGGYDRYSVPQACGVALLFHVIRIRWWPDLSVEDDDDLYEETGQEIWQYGLVDKFRDEELDGEACVKLFGKEYKRRNP